LQIRVFQHPAKARDYMNAATFHRNRSGGDGQLPFNTTVAITYANSRGLHMLRSRNVNEPLAGTYNPDLAGSGVYPLGPVGAVF
jgi:hypothetical protein